MRQSLEELQLWRDRYTELFDSAPCGYVTCDDDQRIVSANRTFASLIGCAPEDLVDCRMVELLAPAIETLEAWARHWTAMTASSSPIAAELRLLRRDGTWVDVHLASQAHFDERGELFECRTTVSDITERRRAEARLRESEALARALFDHTTNPIFVIDESGLIADFNGAAERFMGIDRQRLLGRPVPDCFRVPATATEPDILRALREGRTPVEVECRTGEHVRILELSATAVTRDGRAKIVALGMDITERKAAESDLRREVLHDSLTQLPNRILLQQALDVAVKRRRRDAPFEFAVLFLDVDRFKELNDTLGHLFGDRILVQIAARLRSCVREADIVARFGGDEFVVLIDDLRGDHDTTAAAERILESMRQPFLLGGAEVTTGVSIGIALSSAYPAAGADTLIHAADAAMYRAKGRGRGRYEYAHDGANGG